MVLDVASGATRRLGITALEAAWALEGERIAASSGEGVTVSGEDQRFGAMTPTEKAVVTLRWSPTGTALALVYHRVVTEWGAALAVMAPGGAPRTLVPHPDGGFGAVQWSPDGRRLAYTR